ncbi:glycosyltransferase BC10-like isoform X2 [Nymphaea colorata]|uniref:glycosyltransferase BC10-like isoform X2 n=1 Tax=Nymphaea colorata TaxID=210225 RepID=UPI00129E559D|nr:glycosyltransferase BC10-like isoform X2 [Nymphaea colorata]
MKKRPVARFLWLGLKVVIPLGVILCIFAVLRVDEPQFAPGPPIPTIFSGPPKVAFLFLARRHLPLDFLWEHFFKNADEEKFSIYVHSRPGFVFDHRTSRCSYCYGRQLNHSIQVAWGEASMIEAERLLLSKALHDPANQRFVLLSDSCVPLYNFTYIYDYLISSPRSFVDSFLNLKESRYNPKMSHVIPKNTWRKGSQWITVIRRHAELIVTDRKVFQAFKKHCKRRRELDLEAIDSRAIVQKEHNCIPDEHYVQTLLAMLGLENEVERRTLTYTLWNESVSGMGRQGWHPIMFKYADIDLQHIQQIKAVDHVYYETEYRTEWCQRNSTFSPCFLFARKFSRGAAMRLLVEGVLGDFDPGSLLSS